MVTNASTYLAVWQNQQSAALGWRVHLNTLMVISCLSDLRPTRNFEKWSPRSSRITLGWRRCYSQMYVARGRCDSLNLLIVFWADRRCNSLDEIEAKHFFRPCGYFLRSF